MLTSSSTPSPRRAAIRPNSSWSASILTPRSSGGPIMVCVLPELLFGVLEVLARVSGAGVKRDAIAL